MRIVVVCGDPFAPEIDEPDVREELDELHEEAPISEVVHAGRYGIEYYASQWAESHKIQERIFVALYGDGAYIGRAMSFIKMHAHLLAEREAGHDVRILFFGSRGVGDLIRKLVKDGFNVRTLARVNE